MSGRYTTNPSTRNSDSSHFELNVKGFKYKLHKETLAMKSAKVKTLMDHNKLDELHWILSDMDIDERTFELVAKFCYGYEIQFSSENIIPILCTAYHLEMYEEHSSNNLLNKAAIFSEQRILPIWNETVKALRVCNDKIIDKLAEIGFIEIFLHSLVEKALNNHRLLGELIKNSKPEDQELEDLITLPLRLYEYLIRTMSKHNVLLPNIVVSVCNFAEKYVFEEDETNPRNKREAIEAVERLLPHQKGSISCGFLIKSLKSSILLNSCLDCRKGFEDRISKQLDMATSSDLMNLDDGYDIDLLKRIVTSFYSDYNEWDVSRFIKVARTLEDFLFKAARDDDGLSLETFKALGELVVAASCDLLRYSDGIYRAIDVFLERNGDLIDSEKMEVCRVLECRKLSPEACEHAAKNERLPLRIVVQVLFVSQMQIRDKISREVKSSEEEECDEIEDMSKKLLGIEIESENLECVVHRGEKTKKVKKMNVWREVKRKFGCLTVSSSSSSIDACNCQIKKRKKIHHHYK